MSAQAPNLGRGSDQTTAPSSQWPPYLSPAQQEVLLSPDIKVTVSGKVCDWCRLGAHPLLGPNHCGQEMNDYNWPIPCHVSLSCVRPFSTLWTVAHQAPSSMGFSRQEYWSGLPFPSLGDLPNPGIEPRSPELQADALISELPGGHHQLEGDRKSCQTDKINSYHLPLKLSTFQSCQKDQGRHT